MDGWEGLGLVLTHPIGFTSLAFFCVRGRRRTAPAIPPAMAMLRGRLAILRKEDMFACDRVIEVIGVEWLEAIFDRIGCFVSQGFGNDSEMENSRVERSFITMF